MEQSPQHLEDMAKEVAMRLGYAWSWQEIMAELWLEAIENGPLPLRMSALRRIVLRRLGGNHQFSEIGESEFQARHHDDDSEDRFSPLDVATTGETAESAMLAQLDHAAREAALDAEEQTAMEQYLEVCPWLDPIADDYTFLREGLGLGIVETRGIMHKDIRSLYNSRARTVVIKKLPEEMIVDLAPIAVRWLKL